MRHARARNSLVLAAAGACAHCALRQAPRQMHSPMQGACNYGYIWPNEPLGWDVAAITDFDPDYSNDSCGCGGLMTCPCVCRHRPLLHLRPCMIPACESSPERGGAGVHWNGKRWMAMGAAVPGRTPPKECVHRPAGPAMSCDATLPGSLTATARAWIAHTAATIRKPAWWSESQMCAPAHMHPMV